MKIRKTSSYYIMIIRKLKIKINETKEENNNNSSSSIFSKATVWSLVLFVVIFENKFGKEELEKNKEQ